ncbi:uncharacterized protein LOC127251435 [Andrographis paniculata]|uniref:uncharacterized protein LOC127251435 n=1 Tax=Andrographis paniculata TaxID=175694 RepID=UPI0021E8719D|nr:uncharacterized protein LOC127251435 [Andrographis paniculata]
MASSSSSSSMGSGGQVLSNYAKLRYSRPAETVCKKPSISSSSSSPFTTRSSVVPFPTTNTRRLLMIPNSSKLHVSLSKPAAAAASPDGIPPSAENEEEAEKGVSLGTLKLPSNTDLARFETLLFQWGNSLCQGANLPLPAPLKVDKIRGGARLGFISMNEEDKPEVLVYIDCLVFPARDGSGPMFRAVRKGPKNNQVPPGEPRIMRSLLAALKKCVAIASSSYA